MEPRNLRVGQPITPEQFDELTDEQLARLVPRAYREFFPGKDFCADGFFYLHDGTAWSWVNRCGASRESPLSQWSRRQVTDAMRCSTVSLDSRAPILSAWPCRCSTTPSH